MDTQVAAWVKRYRQITALQSGIFFLGFWMLPGVIETLFTGDVGPLVKGIFTGLFAGAAVGFLRLLYQPKQSETQVPAKKSSRRQMIGLTALSILSLGAVGGALSLFGWVVDVPATVKLPVAVAVTVTEGIWGGLLFLVDIWLRDTYLAHE